MDFNADNETLQPDIKEYQEESNEDKEDLQEDNQQESDNDTSDFCSSSSNEWVKPVMSKAEKAEYQKRRRWEYSLFEDYRIRERDRSRVSTFSQGASDGGSGHITCE